MTTLRTAAQETSFKADGLAAKLTPERDLSMTWLPKNNQLNTTMTQNNVYNTQHNA